jgi:peptidoglycan/LPS O-acetylase OafA/YrhL
VSTSAETARSRRLAEFDGLRAVAALTVLAYHVSLACSLTRFGTLAPLLAELKAGVAVFFVLSGFLLYLPCAKAIVGGNRLPVWRAYANRRALRILPGYWVALAVLAAGPLRLSVATPNWWRYLSLAEIYKLDTILGGLGVAWSLCVEVSFYALLPLFAIAMQRLARGRENSRRAHLQLLVLAALAAGTVIVRLALTGSALAPVSFDHGVLATALPGCMDWFAAGMALAVLDAAWTAGLRMAPWTLALARRAGLCWSLAAACFAGAASTAGGDLFLPLYGLCAHLLTGAGAALLVLPVVGARQTAATGVVVRTLRHPVICWLGTVSYGIYLWHVPLLQAIWGASPVRDPAALAVAGLLLAVVVGAIALGAASWYLVERPAQRLFAVARRPQAVPAQA